MMGWGRAGGNIFINSFPTLGNSKYVILLSVHKNSLLPKITLIFWLKIYQHFFSFVYYAS